MLNQHVPNGGFFMCPSHRASARKEHPTNNPFFTHALQSLGVSLLLALLLLLACSLAAYFTADPNSLIRPLALLASALTAILGGFFAAKRHPQAPILSGVCNGLLLLTLMLLASLFFSPSASGDSLLVCLLLHTAFLLCSLLGALIASRAKPTKKKKRRSK